MDDLDAITVEVSIGVGGEGGGTAEVGLDVVATLGDGDNTVGLLGTVRISI